jgi:ribosomal-protein-alanine N-acetyltransferase
LSGLEIVRATPAAAERMAALHAAAFDRPWSASEFGALLHLPTSLGLTARLDGAEAGLALVRIVLDEAELLTIGVSPEARGVGVGAALLERCEAEAAKAGAARLFLEVSDRNEAAARLYRRAGYVETGRRARYYADGSDARLMEKALEAL